MWPLISLYTESNGLGALAMLEATQCEFLQHHFLTYFLRLRIYGDNYNIAHIRKVNQHLVVFSYRWYSIIILIQLKLWTVAILLTPMLPYWQTECCLKLSWAPPWSSGSVLAHRSLPPVFESRRGHIWRLFCLSLRLITFGSRSAHLAYIVHKSGHKTSIIIFCLKLSSEAAVIMLNKWMFTIMLDNMILSWYEYDIK